jgi:protein TonB
MKRILVNSLLIIGLITGFWPGKVSAQDVAQACDSTYRVVDEMPIYKNGQQDLLRDIRKEFKFGGPCRPDKITVKWVVTTLGKVTQVEVSGIEGTCQEDFIHQFELLPPWKPGKRKGRPVCVRMSMPIYIDYSDRPDGY